MTKALLAPTLRSKIVRLPLLHGRPDAIAKTRSTAGTTAVYQIDTRESFHVPFAPFGPRFRRPRRMSKAAGSSSVTFLEQQPWALQTEMVWCLWERTSDGFKECGEQSYDFSSIGIIVVQCHFRFIP